MSTAIATQKSTALTIEQQALEYRLALNSNLWGMPDKDVWAYYKWMAERLGVDPASRPFDVITDQNKKTKVLYANSGCTSQLGDKHKLSYGRLEIDVNEALVKLGFNVAHVSVEVRALDGRTLVSEAFVDLNSGWEGKPLAGNNLVNALKKAGTQCRRRGTLQMLGYLAAKSDDIPTIKLGDIERPEGYDESITIEQLPESELMALKSADETVNEVLIDAFCAQKGEKNGRAFFDSVWAGKSFAEREAKAKELGLTAAIALDTEAVEPEAVVEVVVDPRADMLAEVKAFREKGKAYASELTRQLTGLNAVSESELTDDQLSQLLDGLSLYKEKAEKK